MNLRDPSPRIEPNSWVATEHWSSRRHEPRPTGGRIGDGFDPCAVIAGSHGIETRQDRELVFILGAGSNLDEVRGLIRRFRGSQNTHEALEKVRNYWNEALGAAQVETPDAA